MVQRTSELQLQNGAKETANLKPDPTMAASYDLFMPPSAGNEGDVWTVGSDGKSVFLPPSTSGGDVVGPSSSVAGNFASFSGTTGKEIEDSGVAIADFATASQGALADSSLQPDDIGSTVQAYDATLQSLSSLGSAADKIAYTTGVDTWAETALTSFGRILIADADAAAARSTLSLTAMAQAFTPNKGQLAAGSGGGSVGILDAGTNDYVLTADSSQTTGLKWAAIPTQPDATTSTKGIASFNSTYFSVSSGAVSVNTTNVVTTSDSQTLTNKTLTSPSLTNPTITNYTESFSALGNSGTDKTINLDSGTILSMTLNNNCTITFPSNTAGKSFLLILKQDGSGGKTVTWDSDVRWSSSIAPTLTSTANKVDIFSFVCDGTYWYGATGGQNYL